MMIEQLEERLNMSFPPYLTLTCTHLRAGNGYVTVNKVRIPAVKFVWAAPVITAKEWKILNTPTPDPLVGFTIETQSNNVITVQGTVSAKARSAVIVGLPVNSPAFPMVCCDFAQGQSLFVGLEFFTGSLVQKASLAPASFPENTNKHVNLHNLFSNSQILKF